jgi:hypothetical protein
MFACLKNHGRGLAKYPLLALKVMKPLEVARYGLDGNGCTGLPARVRNPWDHGWVRFAGGANDIVHPGSMLEVTQIELEVQEAVAALDDQIVEYEIGCDGASLQRGAITLSGHDLVSEAHTALREWKL